MRNRSATLRALDVAASSLVSADVGRLISRAVGHTRVQKIIVACASTVVRCQDCQ
jgi:hypothetical protein